MLHNLFELLTKLGYKTDEEVREEVTKKLEREVEKNRKSWEEKLREMSDSERLDVIDLIVRYETDLERMRRKIIKVLESRPTGGVWEEDEPFDDWFWKPSYPGGIFRYPWHQHR